MRTLLLIARLWMLPPFQHKYLFAFNTACAFPSLFTTARLRPATRREFDVKCFAADHVRTESRYSLDHEAEAATEESSHTLDVAIEVVFRVLMICRNHLQGGGG